MQQGASILDAAVLHMKLMLFRTIAVVREVIAMKDVESSVSRGFGSAGGRSWDREGEAMCGTRRKIVIKSARGWLPGVPQVVSDDPMYNPAFRWYAVNTRSRQEKVASTMLQTYGIQHFLPLKSELRLWSDRKQMVEMPVFPGYMFVRINLAQHRWRQVLEFPGIVAYVGNQTGPLPIPDREIEDIRAVLTARVACVPCPPLHKGDRVRLIRGPLAGVEGTLAFGDTISCLLVSVEMIRQSLAIRVLREDVELITLG